MGKPPAVIIISRHGARLDAEDSTWAQSSPAPYDTPLSYGGWTQTRALGARIAALLHAREITMEKDENATAMAAKRRGSEFDVGKTSPIASGSTTPTPSTKRPKKKHKVIIHSSPFLRCVQSSIAISAGMAQYEGNLAKFELSGSSGPSGETTPQQLFSGPKRSMTLDSKAIEEKYTSRKETSKTSSPILSPQEPIFRKNTLRVDGFLGEWLSPDYFEFIAPPPKSNMMVAGAKADLLRAATPVQGLSPVTRNGQSTMAGQDGSESIGEASGSKIDLAFSMDELRESLSNDSNTTSHDPNNNTKTHHRPRKDSLTVGYVPPLPSYALSGSQPIPPGYVAHAREACVNIDFQWDSMRPPQDWGDGGQHGEEWSSMHKRFRRGIASMIEWYKDEGPYYDPQDSKQKEGDERREADGDEETVLILVTHGAGCNALLGALTNQPVLMDIGMGSLTMAVRRANASSLLPSSQPNAKSTSPSDSLRNLSTSPSSLQTERRSSSSTSTHIPPIRRRSSVSTSLANIYEMRLIASTEHLRAGADPLQIPQLRSPKLMPSIPELSRSGPSGNKNSSTVGSSGSSTPTSDMDKPLPRIGKNSALGSMRRRRTGSSASGYPSASSPVTSSPALGPSIPRSGAPSSSSSGLWGTSNASQSSFGLSSSLKAAHAGLGSNNSSQIRSLSHQDLDEEDGDGGGGFMLNFQSEVEKTRPRSATADQSGSGADLLQQAEKNRSGSWHHLSHGGDGSGDDGSPAAAAAAAPSSNSKGLWGGGNAPKVLDTGNVSSSGLSNRRRATLVSNSDK